MRGGTGLRCLTIAQGTRDLRLLTDHDIDLFREGTLARLQWHPGWRPWC